MMATRLFLLRHGETEWTLSGQHTGRTDIPLTEYGCDQARRVRDELKGQSFVKVLTSPLSRALDTCRLAGLGDQVETVDDLLEWNYGDYEGVTTDEIRKKRPRWSLWLDGAPGGETAADVGARVDRVIKEVRQIDGEVAICAHGHGLRVLAARWVGLPPSDGRLFALEPASLSILGYERETPVVQRWNAPAGL